MLKGKTNEEKIWNYLIAAGLTPCGAAGLMGNLFAESGLNPQNLQNSCEKRRGMTDAAYTVAVDKGTYTNFVRDSAGYGLAQWTYWSRKKALLDYAKSKRKSVGDLETQLGFLLKELEGYSEVMLVLRTAKDVRAASDCVLLNYERPANQGEAVKAKRAGYGQAYYDKYAEKENGMTENELRSKVVSIAKGWLGRKESDGSHKAIIDLYNSHKPLARGYAVKYTDAWCATFVSAVFIKAGLTDIAPTECSCSRMIELYKKMGRWQEIDAYVPQPGDLIMYDWQDSGSGDNTGAPDHVGMVVSVSGKSMTIIEGNKNDAVSYRNMTINGKYIRGYCCPDYASKAKMTVFDAIDRLAALGVINSPDYWEQAVVSEKVPYLDELLIKAAGKITGAGERSRTVENAVVALAGAGIIDTLKYWLSHKDDYPNLDALLCALGGAVR